MSASTIRCNCPDCGEIDLSVFEVMLSADHGHYEFVCPKCRQSFAKVADARIVHLLEQAGVGTLLEMTHPEAPDPDAPWLTEDDLLDFHDSLDAELSTLLKGNDATTTDA